MPRTSKAATIKDIAGAVGVSTAAVSHALRPNPASNIKLQDETIERIRDVALKLNYRAHLGARSIRANRFQAIGFFTAKTGNAHSPDGYLAGLHDAAEEHRFHITHLRLPRKVDKIKSFIPSILNNRGLDALVIGSYHPVTSYIHKRLKGDNLPVVFINDRLEENSIYVDEETGAAEMTRHLIQRGYRKICFVLRTTPDRPPMEKMHHSAADRLAGFKSAMNEAGLRPRVFTLISEEVVGGPHRYPSGWTRAWKQSDALMAYDDDLANQLGRYFYERGIRIPEDIGLTGYNGDYGSLCAWQELTTMKIPAYEMGREAFSLVKDLIENPGSGPLPSRKILPSLVTGKSLL